MLFKISNILCLVFTLLTNGYTQSLTATEKKIDSLIKLNRSLINKGDFDKAFDVINEAELFLRDSLLRQSPVYAKVLFNIGRTYDFSGDLQEAQKYYEDSRDLRAQTLGVDHPEYAWSLNNLAYIDFAVGRYEAAEAKYLAAKRIWENSFGNQHPLYANVINNLASLYRRLGSYDKAESMYLESSKIRKEALGDKHVDYASSINNLANLYLNIRNYDKAAEYYLKAKLILREKLGEEHPDVLLSQNNLALALMEIGELEKAESLHLEVKRIRAETIGADHPNYAQTLNNLGNLYTTMHLFDEAESVFEEAKQIRYKLLGAEHSSYAQSLNNLAILYKKTGEYLKAEKLFLEALRIREKTIGIEHPKYAQNLINLADSYCFNQKIDEAEAAYLQAIEIEKNILAKASLHLSENELLNFIAKFEDHFSRYLSFIQKHNKPAGEVFDNSLYYKGFLLNSTQKIKRLANNNDITKDLLSQLKANNRLLAIEYSKPINSRRNLEELEQKSNELEKEMARKVTGFSESIRKIEWQDIQDRLSQKSAAIEFIHFDYYNPKLTDTTKYAAILLKKNEAPKLIHLFDEASLTAILNFDLQRKSDYVNELYSLSDRGASVISKKTESLNQLVWAPLEDELKEIDTLYYSPSGLLHRINFNAIPIDIELTIGDQLNCVLLNSCRSLAIVDKQSTPSSSAILYGGINYEIDSTILETAELNNLSDSGSIRSQKDNNLEYANAWNFLHWTSKEIESIERTLSANIDSIISYDGINANEETFKSIGEKNNLPDLIHIATHGFFFSDPDDKNEIETYKSAFQKSNNPMIRSGLILSGANYAWTGQDPIEGIEDGILTAYEISQMDLSETKLVTLSACETGLGQIQGNEGVYGLQRAFKIAGIKYIIMSLWQVPDRQTKDFMVSFYKNWFDNKMPIADAFRSTQNTMKERFYDPYMWAGFVLIE